MCTLIHNGSTHKVCKFVKSLCIQHAATHAYFCFRAIQESLYRTACT